MNYPWFRLYSEIIDDPKLRGFSDSEKWDWVCLLCLANDSGVRGTIPMTLDDIGWRLRRDPAAIEQTIQKCVEQGMVQWEPEDGSLTITQFIARQHDHPSDTPDQTRDRKRRQREREKSSVTSGHDSVTKIHEVEERRGEKKREETEREREETPAPTHFEITSEMRTWALEQIEGIDVDAETAKFIDWNLDKGRTSEDWIAAWRYWIRQAKPKQLNGTSLNGNGGNGSGPVPPGTFGRPDLDAMKRREAILLGHTPTKEGG